MQYQILVVEDQGEISRIVMKYLSGEGYRSYCAKDGFEALDLFRLHSIHLILLDIMMPGIDGFDVLREVRKISDVPVIMVTAKQEEIDRLKGFDIGADDYVIKPFSVKELMKRIRVILRRVYHNSDEMVYRYKDLSLRTKSMTLWNKDEEIAVTAAEYALLEVFFRHQGQVLSREQLIEMAYGFDYDGYERNIDSYIKRIRQKIEPFAGSPQYLITKYGAGYLFGGDRDDT